MKMHHSRCALAALALLLVTGGSSPAKAADKLAERIEAIIDADEFKHAHWGLLIVDGESGDTLYERSADKFFAPASTTKLYSVATALDELGAEYRFETPIYATSEPDKEGELSGNLVLVASGDLSMGGERIRPAAWLLSIRTTRTPISAARPTLPRPTRWQV